MRRISDPGSAPITHALARLARPRARPVDVGVFTPDLYPDGPPLVPAEGPPPGPDAVRARLEAVAGPVAVARFDDDALRARVPDPGVRAGLAALVDTVAEPVLDAFLAGALPVATVAFGTPAGPGRIVGPGPDGATERRLVDRRYAAEEPALFAPSLAHDLLWRPSGAGKVEETILHAVAAMVHVQRIAARPDLATLRTELARRQHSLALALLLSRHPGSGEVTLVAPDGPGTLPGGAAAMATADFWGVPFGSGASADPDAPPVLAAVLRRAFGDGAAVPGPLRYDDGLVALCTQPLGPTWCPAPARLRVAVALGLVDA